MFDPSGRLATEAARRIATEGRGGYRYHLNGAFGLLLASLGFSVRGHVGGAHGPDGPTDAERGNHLVLTIHRLPTDPKPGGSGTSTPVSETRCTTRSR